MKKLLLVLTLTFSLSIATAQVYSLPQYALDTIAPHILRGEVGALFKASFKEKYERVDLELNATLGLQYLSKLHDYRLSIDWHYETGSKQNDSTHKAYVMAAAGLFKYRYEGGKMIERKMFVAPIYIYHQNSDRGLEWRHQAGLLFQPYGFKSKRIWFNVMVGAIYNYSSWDIYDDDYASLNGSQGNGGAALESRSKYIREFEPMVMLNFFYKPTDNIGIDITGYAQFPTVVPHPKPFTDIYPEYGKLYPHVVVDINFRVALFKGLSLQAKVKSDYEKTRPTIFKKGFEWSALMGLNWRFSTLSK